MDHNIVSGFSQYESENVLLDETQQTMNTLAQRVYNPKLMALRAQLPFIQIMPMTNSTSTVALAANTPTDIQIPSEAKLAFFRGTAPFYVSRNGAAQVPAASVDTQSGSMLNPDNVYFYVEEVQSVSIVSESACKVTVSFFDQM